jgi:hypothetical protein
VISRRKNILIIICTLFLGDVNLEKECGLYLHTVLEIIYQNEVTVIQRLLSFFSQQCNSCAFMKYNGTVVSRLDMSMHQNVIYKVFDFYCSP